jgi:hypothetical protein
MPPYRVRRTGRIVAPQIRRARKPPESSPPSDFAQHRAQAGDCQSSAFAAGLAAIASVIFFTMLLWLLWFGVASVALFLAARSEVAAPRAAPAPTS